MSDKISTPPAYSNSRKCTYQYRPSTRFSRVLKFALVVLTFSNCLMLSNEQHTMANVRRAADLTVLDTASIQTTNSDRTPLHFVTKLPRCTLSSPKLFILDMALTSSMSVLGSSSILTKHCEIQQNKYCIDYN